MRLATGEVKTYYYAWRGGPQIKAKPGTPDFVGAYNDAHRQLRQPRAGTLMTIIAEYKASPEFTSLAPTSHLPRGRRPHSRSAQRAHPSEAPDRSAQIINRGVRVHQSHSC